ncbi:molybdate transport system ATP-binding protein [Chryseobacterium rhizoplanae]|uniref:Molybdate transport system ATP-binding protein n=1 Tax=Chryseobacterium rhizoplanae TaxID=1609531 RepID=A0A521ANE8_9FLAO|nr:ATP-binding cassette domain-containing protein [Chryseobacterium rhizoplanae]SMO36322.1 molybdate transport system ATP-binding protein [Chryseobacterium rhizoplanae]
MIEINIKHQIFTSSGNQFLEINEHFEEGSIVHVSGDSGIGKTTFFKIISGLTAPDCGFIKINNTVLSDTENRIFLSPQKRDISLMFQQYALFPNMTVKKNIEFAQKKRNAENINHLLKIFNLENLKNAVPSKLSGGQQQRVALARTLVQNATVALLDEPFSAVDPAMRKVMKEEIVKTAINQGLTFFVISHNENEFEDYTHKKLVIG